MLFGSAAARPLSAANEPMNPCRGPPQRSREVEPGFSRSRVGCARPYRWAGIAGRMRLNQRHSFDGGDHGTSAACCWRIKRRDALPRLRSGSPASIPQRPARLSSPARVCPFLASHVWTPLRSRPGFDKNELRWSAHMCSALISQFEHCEALMKSADHGPYQESAYEDAVSRTGFPDPRLVTGFHHLSLHALPNRFPFQVNQPPRPTRADSSFSLP